MWGKGRFWGTQGSHVSKKVTVSLTLDLTSSELLHSSVSVMLKQWGSARAVIETKYYLKQRS